MEVWSEETGPVDFEELASNGCKSFNKAQGCVVIGSPDIKRGDRICVFIGDGPHFILHTVKAGEEDDGEGQRKGQEAAEEDLDDRDKTFQLVGDAYLHGLMSIGKAFTTHGRGRERYFKLV